MTLGCAQAGPSGQGSSDLADDPDATVVADATPWRTPDAQLPPMVDAAMPVDARELPDAWSPPTMDGGMSFPDASVPDDAGGGTTCAHSPCDLGGALAVSCDSCVAQVCNLDFYCCLVEWDVSCKNAYNSCGSC